MQLNASDESGASNALEIGTGVFCGHEVGRANGLEVNPRGQGPRGYGSAARRMPAFEARDAGGVTPCKLRGTSRLGRRTEAGSRRVLPRVSPPLENMPKLTYVVWDDRQ